MSKKKDKEIVKGKLIPCPEPQNGNHGFCFKCGWNERYKYNCPFWDYKEEELKESEVGE